MQELQNGIPIYSPTLRVKQDLCLQKCAGQKFQHVVYTQQGEGFSERILPHGELPWPGSLAHNGPLHPVEPQRPSRRRQRHLVQDVVDVALQREGRRAVGGHGLVQLGEELPRGVKERERREEAEGFRHI